MLDMGRRARRAPISSSAKKRHSCYPHRRKRLPRSTRTGSTHVKSLPPSIVTKALSAAAVYDRLVTNCQPLRSLTASTPPADRWTVGRSAGCSARVTLAPARGGSGVLLLRRGGRRRRGARLRSVGGLGWSLGRGLFHGGVEWVPEDVAGESYAGGSIPRGGSTHHT
jgi:hypothetical protein